MDSGDLSGGPVTAAGMVASARGWHGIQLAVLGFIGFCGVMWSQADTWAPGWAQLLAGVLVIAAFLLACLAIFLVGRVAFPLTPGTGEETASRRLRVGVRVTYLAVAVLVAATLTAWWPGPGPAPEPEPVEVRDVAGRVWCGDLVEGPAGGVRLQTGDGPVTVPVETVRDLRPVSICDD